MSLLNKIKQDVKSSGGSKGKFMYWREGDKQRVRFLEDMDEGRDFTFHDSFEDNINVPCQKHFGRECKYCDDDSLRTRSQYLWNVWDHENKEVKFYMSPVNNYTAVPALMAMYENYGTIEDRDFVITQSGKGTNKSFSVIPMDKNKFRNKKAKPYSEQEILKFIDRAWPAENSNHDDDDFDVDESEYQDMKTIELYKLCIEREIEAEKRKPKNYYVNLLEEYDKAQDDWGTDEDDWDDVEDDWDDDEEEGSLEEASRENLKELFLEEYEDKSPVELYKLIISKGYEAEPRQQKEYYLDILLVNEFEKEDNEDDVDIWEEDDWA